MANYFYIGAGGQRRGPCNEQQLQALATRGILTPTTPLETDSGHQGLAGQIPGLKFNTAEPPPGPFLIRHHKHHLTHNGTQVVWWESRFYQYLVPNGTRPTVIKHNTKPNSPLAEKFLYPALVSKKNLSKITSVVLGVK